MKTRVGLLLMAIALFCLVGWTGYAQKERAPKTQWEYTSASDYQELNKLGAQGWELVAVTTNISEGTSNSMNYVLKRAK